MWALTKTSRIVVPGVINVLFSRMDRSGPEISGLPNPRKPLMQNEKNWIRKMKTMMEGLNSKMRPSFKI